MTGSTDAMQPVGESRRAWLGGCLLLLLLSVVVYRPAVTGAGEFEAWDQARVYVPLQVNNARQRTEGEIPLWFRHGFLGYPLQGENECSGVYLPAMAFHLVDYPGTAWSLFLLLHHLLAAGGAMLLLRELGSDAAGATLAGVVLVFGGSFVGEIPQATLVTTLAWVPLLLALWLRACRTGNLWTAAGAGLVLAVQASGAHPQVLFYTVLALGLGVVCEARGEQRRRRAGMAAAVTAVTLLVGLGLAAPQLWYCLQTLQATDRGQGLSYDRQMDGSLPPHFLVQLLLPGATGGDHRMQILFADFRVYAGLLTLPLAVVGWLKGPASARIFRWGLGLSIVLALGRYSGLFLVLGQLPGFSSVHVPARFLMFASLGIAVLGGLGLDHLLRQPTESTGAAWKWSARTLAAVGVGLLGLGLLARFAPDHLDPDWLFGWGNRDRVFVREWNLVALGAKTRGMVWGGLLGGTSALLAARICLAAPRHDPRRTAVLCLLLVSCDVGLAASRLLDFAPRGFYATPPATLQLLPQGPGRVAAAVPDYDFDATARTLDLLPDNSAGLFGLDAFSVNPGARSEWLRDASAAVSPRLHALLHVGSLISRDELPALSGELRGHISGPDGEYWVYDVPDVLPRATICRDILQLDRPRAVLATIASSRFVPGESVILDAQPRYLPGEPRVSGDTDTVDVVTDQAQTLELDATLTRDGIVVLADLFHDGWRATSNGRPVPILRANGLCRGVALGPGQHRLRFEYWPAGFGNGLWISGATLLGLLLCGAVAILRRPG